MDEEELRKRFTDCVYFLASPLTCKKGLECEYRHSEIARLNPTDCWYWLAGSCFSPACAFRHPPLEGYKEAYPETTDPNRGSALPANKTNIPCYFYLYGFCNKGERCSFLHGPDNRLNTHKSSKEISTINNTIPSEKKFSPRTNILPTPTENHRGPFETAQLAPKSADRSESPDITTNPCQETLVRSNSLLPVEETLVRSNSLLPDITTNPCQETLVRSNSLLPFEEFVQGESDVVTDQSSDERVEWLESSPGFDVLVEGESVNARYDEDADYFPVHNDGREINVDYSRFDQKDPIEYDPAYPELRNPLKEDKYENEAYDYLDKVAQKSRKSIFYRLSSQKRNLYDGRRGHDLRDHLKRRKVFDENSKNSFSKRRVFDHRIRRNPPRHRDKRKPFVQHLKPIVQPKKRPEQESASFTGPKTLEEIKEEKKKAMENEDFKSVSDGFKGPRPLNEILKNNRFGNRN